MPDQRAGATSTLNIVGSGSHGMVYRAWIRLGTGALKLFHGAHPA